MTIHTLMFREGVGTTVEVDEENLLFHAVPPSSATEVDQDAVIEEALNSPVGSGTLEEEVGAEDTVAVLVDDITRPTPSAAILPHVLRRIHEAGVLRERVKIVMAMGTHRPMTDEELRVKLGDEVVDSYAVINRDYRETSRYAPLGTTESGMPIEVDKEVLDADFVIGIGNICPHISAGWSGGSKIILPGVCSQKTTDMMHYVACTVQSVLEIVGSRENKPREEMDIIAEKVGLKYIVNTVLDDNHKMIRLFAGDLVEAHKAACDFAEKIMIVPVPAQADILIVSANPCHFDYWQGVKPYTYAHRAVREGGVYIFLLDGGEGLCGDAPSHDYTVRTYLLHSFEQLKAGVASGEITDIVGVNVPMYHSMVRERVAKNYVVTNHLRQRDIDALGFERVDTVQGALEKAYELLGRDAKVGIIPSGGEMLVKVSPESFHHCAKGELHASTG